MRCLNIFLSFALFSSGLMAQSLSDGLEAWYKFDYVQGEQYIKDYSGNNHHLIAKKYYEPGELDLGSNFTWEVDQQRPYVYFSPDRDKDLVFIPQDESWKGITGTQARTLAVWIRIDSGTDPYTGQWLYSYGDDSKSGGLYRVELKGTSIEFANAVNNTENNWCNRNVCWLTSYPQDEWHHIVLVYNGNGNRKDGVKLYVDGKLESMPPVSDDADFSINTAELYAPEIGRSMQGIALSDFRFYSRELSEEEIIKLVEGAEEEEPEFTIAAMDKMIQDAIAANQPQVVIPPGTYRGNAPFLKIEASNLEIIADGVTMVCQEHTRALEFVNCQNVTLRGLTIDYDPLTFTQGEIIEVGDGYVDVQIHEGYPVEPYSRIDIIDPNTHYRKRGSQFIWNATAQKIEDNVIRVYQSGEMCNVAEIGDFATMSTGQKEGGAPHTLVLSNCKGGMVLEDVTVYCGPGFGIFEAEGTGGTILRNCKVTPGPLPENATEPRLLSVSWDAIQHKLTLLGPTVENCEVRDAGDDSWSVTWDGSYIIDAFPAPNRLTLKTANQEPITKHILQVGDTLRTSLTSEFVVIKKVSGNLILLDNDESFPSSWAPGMRIYSPNRRCEHFILRNNHFRSSGRVLVKASHGLIENNVFEDTHCGVMVSSEDELTAIQDITIRNNQISGTGHFMPGSWTAQAGSVSITSTDGNLISDAGDFSDIVIENNEFRDVSGVNIVVTSAKNVLIKDNQFYETGMSTPNNTGEAYGIDQNTVVHLINDEDVIVDNNPVYDRNLGALLKKDNVKNLQEKNQGIYDANNSGGITDIEVPDRGIYYSENTLYFPLDMSLGKIEVYIFDTLGVLEQYGTVNAMDGSATIPYSPLAKGVKVVRLVSENQIYACKILVKE